MNYGLGGRLSAVTTGTYGVLAAAGVTLVLLNPLASAIGVMKGNVKL